MRSVRTIMIALAIAGAMLVTPAGAQDTPPLAPALPVIGPAPTLKIVGNWFDGRRFRPATWYSVGGKLTRRAPHHVDRTLDLRDKFLVPPFAEGHNHNLQNPWTAPGAVAAMRKLGVYYSVQLGADRQNFPQVLPTLNRPDSVDVTAAWMILSASDGHPLGIAINGAKAAGMDVTPDMIRDQFYVAVDNADQLAAKWSMVAETRTPLVKVILIDGQNYAANRAKPEKFGFNGIDPSLLPDIARRTHAMGARLVVHTDTAGDVALAAPHADIIAHLPGYRIDPPLTVADYRLSDATIKTLAKRKVVVIPTMAASGHYVKKHPDAAAALEANYADNMRRLKRAGVTMLTGSDVFDGTVIDELVALQKTGVFSAAELLRMGTMTTPTVMFPNRRIGCFAEGCEASFVVLDRNPLTDWTAVTTGATGLKQGHVVPAP